MSGGKHWNLFYDLLLSLSVCELPLALGGLVGWFYLCGFVHMCTCSFFLSFFKFSINLQVTAIYVTLILASEQM